MVLTTAYPRIRALQESTFEVAGFSAVTPKSRGCKSPQGQQAVTGMDQEYESPQCIDTTVNIGDSIIEGLHNDLLSRATERCVTVRYGIGQNAGHESITLSQFKEKLVQQLIGGQCFPQDNMALARSGILPDIRLNHTVSLPCGN